MSNLSRNLLASLIVTLMVTGHASASATPGNLSSAGVSSRELSLSVLTTGTISGRVTQSDGVTPISGATVKALQGTTTIATTTTNATGDYTLSQLWTGSYTVEASSAGFGTKNQFLVTVTEGGNTTVNLKLDAIVSGPFSYIYDAVGRLVATVGPTETTIYSYDPVGNLLSISRQPSSQLSIISVIPSSGSVGQMVTINGTGFSAVPSENNVQFNGASAAVVSATSTRIITSVPSLGATGQIQISVTTSQGTVNAPFTVLPASNTPSIQVAPSYVSILPGDKLQFFASISGLTGDQSLTWSANGIDGGNSDVGTITSTGFYSSPNLPSLIVAIRATSVANPSVFGQAQVAILNSSHAEQLLAGSVSVLFRPVITETTPTTAAVSVRRDSATVESEAASAPVSVRRWSATDSVAPMAAAVSVRFNEAVTLGSPQSPGVSVTTAPYIQSLSPSSAAKGTSFTLTINGTNLEVATGITFLTSAGMNDQNITISGLTVDPGGTSLTATITVASNAVIGPRVVVVTTTATHSLTVNVGPNVIEITQ